MCIIISSDLAIVDCWRPIICLENVFSDYGEYCKSVYFNFILHVSFSNTKDWLNYEEPSDVCWPTMSLVFLTFTLFYPIFMLAYNSSLLLLVWIVICHFILAQIFCDNLVCAVTNCNFIQSTDKCMSWIELNMKFDHLYLWKVPHPCHAYLDVRCSFMMFDGPRCFSLALFLNFRYLWCFTPICILFWW